MPRAEIALLFGCSSINGASCLPYKRSTCQVRFPGVILAHNSCPMLVARIVSIETPPTSYSEHIVPIFLPQIVCLEAVASYFITGEMYCKM